MKALDALAVYGSLALGSLLEKGTVGLEAGLMKMFGLEFVLFNVFRYTHPIWDLGVDLLQYSDARRYKASIVSIRTVEDLLSDSSLRSDLDSAIKAQDQVYNDDVPHGTNGEPLDEGK